MKSAIVPDEPSLLRTKEAARRLGVHPTKINQYGRDNLLIVLRREDGSFVPEHMLVELAEPVPAVVSHSGDEDVSLPPATHRLIDQLRGTLTLLRDAGFSEEEVVSWLWKENDELAGKPIDLIRSGRQTSVNRIAATLGY